MSINIYHMKERGESSMTYFLLFQYNTLWGHNDAIKISAHSAPSIWVKIRKYTISLCKVSRSKVKWSDISVLLKIKTNISML